MPGRRKGDKHFVEKRRREGRHPPGNWEWEGRSGNFPAETQGSQISVTLRSQDRASPR